MDRQLFKNLCPPTIWDRKRHTRFIILSLTIHVLIIIGLIFIPPVERRSIADPKPMSVSLTFYFEPAGPPSSSPKGIPSIPKSAPPIATGPEKKITPSPEPASIPVEAPSTLKSEQAKPSNSSSSGSSPAQAAGGSETGKPEDRLEIAQGGVKITGGSVNSSGTLRPGGNVKDPKRIHYVEPVYPQAAIAAKIEGMVVIEAVIGTDGRIKSAKVIQPLNPLLDKVAIEAIKQWRYTPSTLAGRPIEILLTVSVHFKIE